MTACAFCGRYDAGHEEYCPTPEVEALRAENERLKAQIQTMHDAGLGKVDTGGTRLSEALAEIERLKADFSEANGMIDRLEDGVRAERARAEAAESNERDLLNQLHSANEAHAVVVERLVVVERERERDSAKRRYARLIKIEGIDHLITERDDLKARLDGLIEFVDFRRKLYKLSREFCQDAEVALAAAKGEKP